MKIDKDKMTIMKMAGRLEGSVEENFHRLMSLVAEEDAEETPCLGIKKEIAVTSAPAVQKKERKPYKKRANPINGDDKALFMSVLEEMIKVHKSTKKPPTFFPCWVKGSGDFQASSSKRTECSRYLKANGYLEKQEDTTGTIWTILKNPDGSPYNPKAPLEATVFPAGKAYGYGEKQDKAKFNPVMRPW